MTRDYRTAPTRAKRFMNLGVLTALAAGSGAGFASAQTVVTWMHVETVPAYIEVWEEIAAAYEQEHPDVDVQLQFLENEAFKAKLPTLLQSDAAPDFFYSWGGGVLRQQSQTGALMDLTEAMNADDGAWAKDYKPAALNGLTYDGKVYAVPYRMGTISFYYNKELFQQAGLKAED
ncbi:MAG: ABC transporter substrate-binding protein, partial [Pseudorhizobium sp.]